MGPRFTIPLTTANVEIIHLPSAVLRAFGAELFISRQGSKVKSQEAEEGGGGMKSNDYYVIHTSR